MENLKPGTPTFRLGRKTFALENRDFKGIAQLSLLEVTPLLDKDNALESWAPVWKGVRLQGTVKDVKAFIAALGDKLQG